MGDDGAAHGSDDPHHARADRTLPLSRPALDPAAKLEALDAVCSAIAHPARRQILLTVHLRGAMTAGDIAGPFGHAWPTTTRHLRVLADAGLLRQERQGRKRVYAVDRERLALF